MLALRTRQFQARTPRLASIAATASVLALLAPGVPAQKKTAESSTPQGTALEQRFEDLGLTLHIPSRMEVAALAVQPGAQVRARWKGKLAASEVVMTLWAFDRAEFGFEEPSDVLELALQHNSQAQAGGDPGFSFDERSFVAGSFGYVSYAALARSSKREAGTTRVASHTFFLAGLLEAWGYLIELEVSPPPPAAEALVVREFLEHGVSYAGTKRVAKWSEGEVAERWKASVPDSDEKKLEACLRTAHYIVLTNSSGGKAFAKKMEECYEAIRAVYPFEEVAERRLMPVFLFQDPNEYYAFFAQAFGAPVEEARRSKGVASRDFYATWYEAPNDPVHIHEATHQIFRNRLGLGGGGSWFQEGVANYMSTKKNDRNLAATAVKKGRHTPLADFVRVESLLFSADKESKSGESEASNHYEQAALVIEFLRESKLAKDQFQEVIHAVGSVRPNDAAAIDAALKRVLGVDLAGLERELVEYCKKR